MRKCESCPATFKPRTNRHKFCTTCANARRVKQNASYKPVHCGENRCEMCQEMFPSPTGRRSYCDPCMKKRKYEQQQRAKDKIRDAPRDCKKCGVTFNGTLYGKLCDKCIGANRLASMNRQAEQRRQNRIAGIKVTKHVGTVNPKFLVRGNIKYEGYTTL